MRINVEKEQLMRGLTVVGKAITGKTNMDVLKGVKIECAKKGMILSGTDNDITICTMIKADIAEEGTIVVEYKILADLIRKLPNSEIEMNYDKEKNVVLISCGTSELSLVVLNADEYPKLPKVSNENTFVMNNGMLKELILSVGYAAAIDSPARPILEGILLQVKDKELNVVALDGYRLAYKKVNIDIDFDFEIVVDKRHMMEIARLLDNEGTVKLSISNNHLVMCIGATLMISRLLEGKYVDYKSLIANECKLQVEMNKQEFLDSIERANLISRDNDKSPVVITLADEKILLSSNGKISKLHEEIACKIVKNEFQEEFKIAFNSSYLIDLLKNSSAEYISLYFKGTVNPCIIRKTDDMNETNLVLPIRLVAC